MEQNLIDQCIRLKKLIKALNLNQIEFAKSLGMSQPNISRMVNGDSRVSAEVLSRIATSYMDVNLHWVLTGDGEVFLGQEEKTSFEITDSVESSGNIGKGRLEDLEERMGQLEKTLGQLVKYINPPK